MKKYTKPFASQVLVFSSFLLSIPNIGNTNLNVTTDFFYSYSNDCIIQDLFNRAEAIDMEGIDFQFKTIAEMLEHSNDALTDSCLFLEDLVKATNLRYGTSLHLSELLQLTRESIQKLQIPESQIEKYLVGLDLIDYHQSELNALGSVRLVKHHKEKSNFWTWLTVATITAAAVTICIVLPQTAPAVIGGAVEVGKAAFGK